ncbi:unnamed protein product [marine sediment metagenome]|uniref:Uncharacterized protein n=1 Tax=marine sediment metagenome TaxID=412755 RepID=X0VY17_9ZZZZ
MKFIEEETFHGEIIETPEEFIEYLYERVNIAYSTIMEDDDKMNQLAYINPIHLFHSNRFHF